MNSANEYFLKLEFFNGKDIGKKQLNDALVKNNYIYIELYSGHISPNIYIPDDVPFSGGIIYIKNLSAEKTITYVYNKQYVVAENKELIMLGSPAKKWVTVVPAP